MPAPPRLDLALAPSFLVLCSFEAAIFVPVRTKPQSITDVFSRLWTPQGEKDLFKTVCFLASTGLERIFLLLFKRYAEERGALAVGAAGAENKARVGALFEYLKLLALHAGGYVARLHGLDGHGRDLVGGEAVKERTDIGDVIHMAAYINT